MPTILHRLARWAEETPEAPAQRYKYRGEWKTITAREYCDRVYHLALFLESKGFTRNDVSTILSPNCFQWTQLDLAAQLVGGKSSGIYPNSTPKDIGYILNHTEAKVMGIANADYFKKVASQPGFEASVERLSVIICFLKDVSFSPKAVRYKDALTEGKALAVSGKGKTLAQYLDGIKGSDEAFIVYTSGTTGNPKGAILMHDNLTYTSDIVAKAWNLPRCTAESPQDLFSFLPLCHIAEKLHAVGVGISMRYAVNFATRFENVQNEIVEVQPTLLLSVPRLWEKMMEGVTSRVRRSPPVKRKLALWALEVGRRVAEAKFERRWPSVSDFAQYQLADKLVLSKIREALGLKRATHLASGAAALPAHVSRWFRSLGLEVLDTLGQTESTGIICVSEPGVDSAGTVGKPVASSETKIADDGELFCRGRQVFKGYYKDPAQTAETLEGGWLRTGDLVEWTPKGLLRVKGRKKEIMKTSGGKMVAPLPLEEKLKVHPLISQVCIVGDGRKYLSALLTLKEGTKAVSDGPVITDPGIVSQVKKIFDDLNRTLASYEQIKRFAILSKEFSIEEGEMTPTMKMKRSVIESHYAKIVDSFYGGVDTSDGS